MTILSQYKEAYRGIRKEVWILSAIQLINRSGSMVLPFLTIYMTSSLGLNVKTAGLIMSCYGIGSILGAFISGKLTDRIGPFIVMNLSLVTGAISYFLIPFFADPLLLGIAVFLSATLNEGLRPANSSMVANFAQGATFTRSFSLLRMAVNLGVAIGPALAGILAGIDYRLLFIGDGLTNLSAAAFFYFYFRRRRPDHHLKKSVKKEKSPSPYRDTSYLLFIFLCLCYATAFFQILNGIPLYYKNVYDKTETAIGLLLGLNGLIVFVCEMITVYTIESRFQPRTLIVIGSLLLAASFLLFNISHDNYLLIISMLLLSFSEIFAMPFMISYVVMRSDTSTRGSYLAGYTMMWSLSLILSPYAASHIIDAYNYKTLWWVMCGLCLFAAVGFNVVMDRKHPADRKKQSMEGSDAEIEKML